MSAPASGAKHAMVYALYHPAAALRSTEVERQSFDDVAGIPAALLEARRRRASQEVVAPVAAPSSAPVTPGAANATSAASSSASPASSGTTPASSGPSPASPATPASAAGFPDLPGAIRPDDPGPSLDPMTLF